MANNNRDGAGRWASGPGTNPAPFSSPTTSETVSLNDFKGNAPRPAPSMGSNPRPVGLLDDGTTQQAITSARGRAGIAGRLASAGREGLISALNEHLDAAEANSVGSTAHATYMPPTAKYNGAGQVIPATRIRSNLADGPLGSTGEPAGGFLSNTPGTFGGVGGGY